MKGREFVVTTVIAALSSTNQTASNAVTKNSPPGEQHGNTQTAFHSAMQIRDSKMNTIPERPNRPKSKNTAASNKKVTSKERILKPCRNLKPLRLSKKLNT